MKRFTIIFSVLLVLAFAGTLAGVGLSEDFVNPAEAAASGEDMSAPIWGMTMDEVLSELEEQGLIETSGLVSLAAGGLCSNAVKVTNGAEFYWWDVEHLDENSQEYKAYKQLKEEGVIDIYGSGNIMSLVSNGPFAMLLSLCDGDVNALDEAFRAVGQTSGGSADDRSAPVWSMTMDDLLAYLVEEGFLASAEDTYLMSSGVGTVGRGFDGAELYWWDVDNLAEGSNEKAAYQNVLDGEPIDLWQQGTMYMAVTQNGPFALAYANYSGDGKALLAAFEAFGRGEGGSSSDSRSAPVWSMTLDDLAAYLADQGVVDAADCTKINYGADERVRTGYRFSDQIDIVYYDFDQMDEASDAYQEYDSISSTGALVYTNGQVGYFWVNGPFSLHFYEWGSTQVPEEEQEEIIGIFQAFGRE